MLIAVPAVVVAALMVLAGEALVARRGDAVDTPDVATLTTTNSAAGATGELRVLWLGDSTAAAVGTSAARYAVSSVVSAALSEACGVTITTRVIAVSGARADDVLRDQVPVAETLDVDVVLISVGANDTIHLTSPTRFATTYRTIVDRLVASGVAPGRIVTIGVPDMGSPPRLAQPLRALVGWRGRVLDRAVRGLAREKATKYVDLFAGTSKIFRKDPGRYFAADRYHPSDEGYAVWGRVIAPVAARACRA